MKENFKKTAIFLIAAILVYVILFLLIDNGIISNFYVRVLVAIGINIILAVSLNLIMGFTGQLALGHAGFMSIGAYAAAILTLKLHLPFLVVILLSGVFAGIVGFIIGLPTLRLKGDYLAITTLGFCQIIMVIIQNINALGGAGGLAGIPAKNNFTLTFIITVVVVLIIYNIIHSSQGRAMISVREDEIAAEAMGVNTTKYKIIAFVIGAFFAGIAGGLYSLYNSFIEPTSFDFLKSVDIVTYVVFGGMGSLVGSILSAAILTVLPYILLPLNQFRMIIYPLMLLVFMILMGTNKISLSKIKKSLKKFGHRGDKDATTQG